MSVTRFADGSYRKRKRPCGEELVRLLANSDADIFGTGKIIDQVFDGILAGKVLVAELTSRNPNVFYELGVAHGLGKPVVLISATEADVPFDLQHIRRRPCSACSLRRSGKCPADCGLSP